MIRHPALIISLGANDLVNNRYGFITSKYLGNAVVRNRLRRLLREAVRMVHASLRPGHDVLLIARPALIDLNLVEIQQVVKQLCQRANLWMENDR